MNGFLTPSRFARTYDLPISLAQTELRRGRTMQVAQFNLAIGQAIQLRSLTLNLCRLLTFGQNPEYANTCMGMVSVGLYFGPMITSPLAYTKNITIGVSTINPWAKKILKCPGLYSVLVSNNTSNIDASVCVAGSLKLYT